MHPSAARGLLLLLLPSEELILESAPHDKPANSSFSLRLSQAPAESQLLWLHTALSHFFGLSLMNMFLHMLQGSLKQPRLPHATISPGIKESGLTQIQALLRLPGSSLSPGSTEAGWGLKWKNEAKLTTSPGPPLVGLTITFESILLFSFSSIRPFCSYE